MFNEVNGIAYINGQKGIYDGKINNNSVRYARNAVDNYNKTYSLDAEWFKIKAPEVKGIASLDKDTFDKKIKEIDNFLACDFPPIKFNLKYAENKEGKPDKMAVLGAAFEELGKKTSVSVKELTKKLQDGIPFANSNVSAEALDVNKDGQIDISEYGASIIVEDMLSSDPNSLKAENITGELTNEGQNHLIAYTTKQNLEKAKNIFKNVHEAFELGTAQKEFLANDNNMI